MGNSLRDQLLKAGLVDKQKVKQAKHEKHKEAKQQRSGGVAADPGKQRAEQALNEKTARDRELNRQRKAESERKALEAQIRQLIEANRLPKNDGDIAYNFTDGTKIRRLYITAATRQQLGSGQLAIVKLNGQYDIVPAAVAEKIRQRDAACVVAGHAPQAQRPEEADPYANYPVPDDLLW